MEKWSIHFHLITGDCDGCGGGENQQSLVINFVNAQPTESEKETYDEAEAFLKDCETLLEQLKSFKGTYWAKIVCIGCLISECIKSLLCFENFENIVHWIALR